MSMEAAEGYPAPATSEGAAVAGDGKAAASAKKEKGGKKASAAAVPAGPPPEEKSAAELAKMSKEERTAYHLARRAAPSTGGAKDGAAAASATAPAQLTKAQRRALQESQRKVKEDKANEGKDGDELFSELKLQGLSEDQAREVMNAMRSGEEVPDEDSEDDDQPEDLLGSVKRWMEEQLEGPLPADAMRDFNMKVRFQGHVNTTPPDHLGAILNVLLEQAFRGFDLATSKPGAVAKALTQVAERWTGLLRDIYTKIPDVLDAVGAVIGTISHCVLASGVPSAAQDTAVVGCLMAIRELEDLIEDEDLLVGCKGIEPRSHVLEKYIEFLEEALEEDDSEEGESDKE